MTDCEIIAGQLYRCERCRVKYWMDAGEHMCLEDRDD